jgi:hypothetical protein
MKEDAMKNGQLKPVYNVQHGNVLAESVLLAMAHNVNKLHNKIQLDRTGTHLFSLKESA